MKKKSILIALISLLTMISIFTFQACKKDKEAEDPGPPTYTNGEGEIGSLGGTITINDASSPINGVTIIVPEGALQEKTYIQIVSAPDTVEFPGSSTQPIVQLLPDGISFQEPITITMPFVSNNPNNIGLYYYDPSAEIIEELEDVTINVQEGLISGLTNHFSYYTAADREVRATMNMFRTQEGVIGVRLDIFGTNNIERGLKWIPTTWWHKVQTLDQELNIWQVLTNPEGPHDGNVYSIFDVFLREGELIGSDPVSASHFSIIREENDPFKVKIIQRFPTNELYSSGFLHTEDIENNISEMDYKNLGNWISGEPLIFLFDDFVPDPDKNYFVKVKWVLASEPNASPLFNYSPKYELNNKPDKKKLHQMSMTSLNEVDIDENYVQDEFQVWGVNTAPECNFSADKTTANVDETIQFNDQSDFNPESWLWDFGDGNTSTQANPTHSYSSEGNYSVSLEVSNQFGSDTKTIEDYIQVVEGSFIEVISPNGDEEWTIGSEQEIIWNDNIDENVKITLLQNNTPSLVISNSTTSSGGFNWTIPSSITTGSNYKIKIESVTNSETNDVSNDNFNIVEQGNILVTNPNTNTTWTMGQYNVPIEWETGDLGGTVTIQVYKGDDKLGTPTPDAPNNGSYTGYNVQTTLAEGNDYRIKIISNANPEKFDFSDYFEIIASDNLPPEPPFDPYPEDGEVISELTANLFWSCEDPENDPLTYDVYAEKDNPNPSYILVEGLTTNTIFYENLEPGATYYWKVVAKDDHENVTESGVWSFETEQQGEPPVADFTADVTNGDAPLTVSFNDLSINEPTSWLWDFGDGGTSTQEDPVYTYDSPGIYSVSLLVENDFGNNTKLVPNYITVEGGGEPCPGTPTVTDADGNVYNTILIGNQCWMRENLNVGIHIDGSQNSTDNGIIEKFCYDDNPENCEIYGGLYNWYEAMQYSTDPGAQGICPQGWHIPTVDEWTVLTNYLGGSSIAGGKMKEEGTTHWFDPNTGANNLSGFTALPGGYQIYNTSLYFSIGEIGRWFTSNRTASYPYYREVHYNTETVTGEWTNNNNSLRCIKD